MEYQRQNPSMASLLILLAMFSAPLLYSTTITVSRVIYQYGFNCGAEQGCFCGMGILDAGYGRCGGSGGGPGLRWR